LHKFRLVLLKNPERIEVKHIEEIDFKELKTLLNKEEIIGIFIGKE